MKATAKKFYIVKGAIMENNKYSFQKLTPVSNADISVYEEAIDFVFSNSDVKNVAISGAYSAGKSSILESYKAKHDKQRFVHISLAHFRTPEHENNESENDVKESILEGKILNQLIHQIKADKIPQTNFRVKKGVDTKSLALLTLFICLLIGSISFLLLEPQIVGYIAALPDGWVKSVLSIFQSPYAPIVMSLLAIFCSIIFIFSLTKAQKNKNILRKISLQGNEIEIFEDQDDSYFDKYLNEVLYLFENVDADIIVFEDMDRFNASRIFERLREVNTLINVQRRKDNGDNYVPLRFFYLLRDDIFISKDRTKFFDYIIPIVPVVDSSNSYEQFLKHLKDGNLLDKFDQSFLQSLSLYVDDMRILKNIYNEFVIYIHRLNTTDLDWNKMMAIIAYKNLFPRDFSDLQLARGFVFELFAQKEQLISKDLSDTKEQKEGLLERIEWAKKEILTSQQELDDAYAAKNNRLPKDRYYTYNLSPEGKVLKEQYDVELPKRKRAVQDVLDGNLPNLEEQLAAIERNISLAHTKSLQALISRENINSVFAIKHTNEIDEVNEFKEIKGSDYFDLLKFLIRNGHIDETYNDYMTYFYDDSISANDKTFLRRITDKRGAEYGYTLKEPNKIIESPVLRNVEFEQEEALNFDLLECLLLNDTIPRYASYQKTLFKQIEKSRSFDFVSQFYNTGKARNQLVIKMNEFWAEFFSLALQGSALPSVQIRQYSMDTLYFSNNDIIDAVNIDNCLSEYISQNPDYLAIENPKIKKLVDGFSLIGVSFTTLNYDESNKELFDGVYCQSLYALTFENIAQMLTKEYIIDNKDDITHKNYTLVQSFDNSPLAGYVAKNIAIYIEIILASCDGKISDDEQVAISLLNNSDVEIDAKKRYINVLSTTITDIAQVVESELWTSMLEQGIVIFSKHNFINYFQKHGIDSNLIEYINNEPTEVDITNTSSVFGNEVAKNLYDAIVICNEILTEKYKKMLIDLGYNFDNFEAEDIANEKMEVLINENILQMDTDGLTFVRDKYPAHLLIFIKRNINEYLTLQAEETFVFDEALEVIKWDIADECKIELLAFTAVPISIVEKQYTDVVNSYVITHNLMAEDKPRLYAEYTQYGGQAQAAILSLATSAIGISEILTNNMDINDSLLSTLLQCETLVDNQKLSLFAMSIPNLNEDTCQIHLDELSLSDLKGIFSRSSGRRNYEKSEAVTTILEALKSNGWIYEYRDDERNNDKYVVIKHRPRQELEILD